MQSEILNKLTELRGILDDWYGLTCRSKLESSLYLEADSLINEIKGIYMDEKLKSNKMEVER